MAVTAAAKEAFCARVTLLEPLVDVVVGIGSGLGVVTVSLLMPSSFRQASNMS